LLQIKVGVPDSRSPVENQERRNPSWWVV